VRRIRDRARSLEELAERGRVVPELDDSTVRELVVGNYRLIYEIGETEVHVLGLIHGERDLTTLWNPEARSGPAEI
jgi:toxin ParE1/3/4